MKKILLLALVGLGMAGCATQAPKVARKVECEMPRSKNVAMAFHEAKSTLAHPQCQHLFHPIHERLLEIAKGDPGKSNKKLFKEFYGFASGKGIISRQQGRSLYTSYFSTSYGYMLPDDRNVCSLSGQRDKLMSELRGAARKKHLGLFEILGDKQAWNQAKRLHDDLIAVVDAAFRACGVAYAY